MTSAKIIHGMPVVDCNKIKEFPRFSLHFDNFILEIESRSYVYKVFKFLL